jgi:ribose transport system substrate-binding protein
MSLTSFRRTLGVVGLCAVAALTAACGSASSGGATASSGSSSGGGKKYSVYFSVSFTGNAFREQMIRTLRFAATHPPLSSSVSSFTVSNPQATVQAQNQDINDIIQRKPDILVLMAQSTTGLNPAIQRACAAGITVVSVDSVSSAPCNYQMSVDWTKQGQILGSFLTQHAKDRGTILVDGGIPGVSVSDETKNGYVAAVKQAAGMKSATFFGQLNPGTTKSALANILPANRDAAGVGLVAFGTQAQSGVQAALGKPLPLAALALTNSDSLACAARKYPCFYAATPPYELVLGLKLAIDLRNGKADKNAKQVAIPVEYYSNAEMSIPGHPEVKPHSFKVGVNAFPNLPPTLSFPIAPPWLKMTPAQAAG